MQTKVPEITIGFWIVKLLTTAFGEAASDYVGGHGLPVVAGVATFVLLAAGLIAQLASRRYLPWLYWSVVALIAVFGTMVADVIHLVLSVPYQATTIAFAAILAAVLWSWHRVEGTLDIHSVSTTRRELFYWATVCASFALGTAAGDLLADALHLGFLGAAIVFTLAILIPAFGRRAPRLGEIAGSGAPTSSRARSARAGPTGSTSAVRVGESGSAPGRWPSCWARPFWSASSRWHSRSGGRRARISGR